MRQFLYLVACIGLTQLTLVASCKKNDSENGSLSQRPVARAGDDVLVQLSFCSVDSAAVQLDGSASFDPDSSSLSYSWKHISGAPNFILGSLNLPTLTIDKISVGNFGFELTVTDQEGFIAKDTVNVITSLQQHNLDISFDGDVRFVDNYHYVDFYYDYYTDSVEIKGKFDLPQLGEFWIEIRESSDSADLSDPHYTALHLYTAPIGNGYIFGICSVNFKRLIKQGGGPFNGTIQFESGSANNCGVQFTSLLPLSMNGVLDPVSNKITMRIQGRVYL